MFLADITDRDHNGSGETLTEKGPPVQNIHQQFQEKIIQAEIECK